MFGIIFLLTGTLLLIESPLAGACLLAASGLLLPPIREFVHSLTKQNIPTRFRAVSITILLIGNVIFSAQNQSDEFRKIVEQEAKEETERIALSRQEKIDFFKTNREKVIEFVKTAIENKDYDAAIKKANEYSATLDYELDNLHSKAKAAIEDIKREVDVQKPHNATGPYSINPENDKVEQQLIAEGKKLHIQILEKNEIHPFYSKPSIWGGLTGAPLSIICIPDFEWEKLENRKKNALAAYATSLVPTVKKTPFAYMNISSDAPIAPAIKENVSLMTNKHWGIMVGDIKGIDILSDELILKGTAAN